MTNPASPATATPPGWKLVPVEPTGAMEEAFNRGFETLRGRYRAMIAAAPSPAPGTVGWQAIETAPQTGRTLLLGYFNALGNWRTLRGQWFSDAVIQEEWTNSDVHEAGWFETSVECDDEDSGCWPCDPTHWQPLPLPPTAVVAEEGRRT